MKMRDEAAPLMPIHGGLFASLVENRTLENRPTVVYVDNRALRRESIIRSLASQLLKYDLKAVSLPEDALELVAGSERVAMVLKHLGSASASADDVQEELASFVKRMAPVPVAVLADTEETDTIIAALHCGIRGYLPTTLSAEAVCEAVRLVCAGETYAPVRCLLELARNRVAPSELPRPPAGPSGFSPRQRQILDCLQRGLANKNIAHELGLSEATVKVHVRKIMRRLRATNRTQVVLMTLPKSDPREEAPMNDGDVATPG